MKKIQEEYNTSFRQEYDPIFRRLSEDYLYLKGLGRTNMSTINYYIENNLPYVWWWKGFKSYFDVTTSIYTL